MQSNEAAGKAESSSSAGIQFARRSLAAVFSQVGEQVIHCAEIGAVVNFSALGALEQQACMAQLFQMKRECRGRKFQAAGNDASGQPGWPCLNQKFENGEPRFVGEGAQCENCV